jgi:hypothetical protein
MSGLEPIGAGVRRELGRFGPAAGMAEIVAAWPGAVGEQIALHAWPARVSRDSTLHVATSSSTWAFELTQLEGEIRRRLSEAVGEAAPERLRFAVGHIPETGSDPAPKEKRTVPRVSEALSAEGDRIAAAIEDPALREVVARAAAASLATALAPPDRRSV